MRASQAPVTTWDADDILWAFRTRLEYIHFMDYVYVRCSAVPSNRIISPGPPLPVYPVWKLKDTCLACSSRVGHTQPLRRISGETDQHNDSPGCPKK